MSVFAVLSLWKPGIKNMAKGYLHCLVENPYLLNVNIESVVTNLVNCKITHSKDNKIRMISLLQNP